MNKFLSFVGECASSYVDGIPGVGHVKGLYHYANGDMEKGHRSMEAATRTTAVLSAGIVTGGLGAAAVVGAAAGVSTGVVYDAVATVIDKEVNGEKASLHGTMVLTDAQSPKEVIMGVLCVVGDAGSGAAGNQIGKNIRAKVSGQENLHNKYKKSESLKETNVDPKTATKKTMDAAETSKKADLKKQTGYVTTEVFDQKTNQKGHGHSGGYHREIRKQKFRDLGNKSGYKSQNDAAKAFKNNEQSNLQKKYPEVLPKLETRGQNVCAEHVAFDCLYKNNPTYNSDDICTSTVKKSTSGATTSKQRCANCKAYGDKMGTVVTDCIPDGTPVPSSGYVKDGKPKLVIPSVVARKPDVLDQNSGVRICVFDVDHTQIDITPEELTITHSRTIRVVASVSA